MENVLERAQELLDEMKTNRRYLHQHPETGTYIPETSAYVEARLQEMGYEVQHVGQSGLCVLCGDPSRGRTILLRADMDALPMKEESGLPFAATGEKAHCCGHDMHTTMMLATARILKEREDEIKGCVKMMFQPGEEVGGGAKEMIDAGILENPKPDAVFGLHVNAKAPAGRISYGRGCTFASNDSLRITVTGAAGHGARPHEAKDALHMAVKIYEALRSIRLQETSPMDTLILSITAMNAGSSCNVLPGKAELLGTLRTYTTEVHEKAKARIKELAEGTAKLFGGSAEVEFLEGLPPMFCAPAFTDEILGYAAEAVGADRIEPEGEIKMGSEDFAFVTELYPDACAYLFLGAGPDEKTPWPYGQHNTKVVFNEDVMPYGTAVTVTSALRWLENHPKES